MPRPPRIGPVVLRPGEPVVIASFTDRTPLPELRRAKKRGLALLEARVDLFDSVEPKSAVRCVGRARAVLPVLVTVRSADEGGSWKPSERERLELYRALLPHADAVDVELDAAIRPSVARAARAAGRTLILSHHDFEKTPSAGKLDDVVARSRKAGADVTKVATLVRDAADLLALAGLLARQPKSPLVVIGMGERGKLTRLLFPALGSRFTFASLGRKTAPGQLDLGETLRELAKYF